MVSCAFAPDGRTIIAGDESGRVHLLSLVEADETSDLSHAFTLLYISFSW
jgi:hypothetical protein